MKINLYFVLAVYVIALTGCYMPVIEGAQQGYDAANRGGLKGKVESDDPITQYELANTYCCKGVGPLKEASIYDNNKATYWYCRSAQQGYLPAQLKLARIYSGSPIRGLHLVLRASNLAGANLVNLPVAQFWAELAAQQGDEDAIELRDAMKQKSTKEDQQLVATYLRHGHSAPCQWADVFPNDF